MKLVIDIKENPTNGDLIKSLFPGVETGFYEDCNVVYGYFGKRKVEFDLDWWNSPAIIEKVKLIRSRVICRAESENAE